MTDEQQANEPGSPSGGLALSTARKYYTRFVPFGVGVIAGVVLPNIDRAERKTDVRFFVGIKRRRTSSGLPTPCGDPP
jgi:hypothetical protein